MSKQKKLLGKLATSVADQAVQSRDKFEDADIVVAMNQIKSGRLAKPAEPEHEAMAGDSAGDAAAAQAGSHQPAAEAEYKVATLPISKVKDHPRNARHIYDPARVDDMATSIARDGQKVPVIVMEDPAAPGTYLLIEGRYRKRALLTLGRDTILASVVEPLSDLEAYRLSLLLNEQRNEQTALDNAMSWRSLLDDGVFKSQEHIAEYLNLKQATVSKTLALLDLPANVLSIVKTNPAGFGIRIGFELKQLAKTIDPKRLEEIAEKIRDGQFSARELEKLRERAGKEPVTRERSRAYPLHWDGMQLGSIREFEDGRLKIDLAGAPDELRGKVIEAVKKALAGIPAIAQK
jgi:ParB family chromosome partitioning protein